MTCSVTVTGRTNVKGQGQISSRSYNNSYYTYYQLLVAVDDRTFYVVKGLLYLIYVQIMSE